MKIYVVWVGRQIGLFNTWAECEMQVKGFKGARYKSFQSTEKAQVALDDGWEKHINGKQKQDHHYPASVMKESYDENFGLAEGESPF